MKWITKASLRIENARLQAQAESYLVQLRNAQEQIAKLESLIDHEREYISAERARADRATDALLQSNGNPPVSTIGRFEDKEEKAEAQAALEAVRKEVGQFYAESVDDAEADENISPEIKDILRGVAKELV